jgi:hypothetical protein
MRKLVVSGGLSLALSLFLSPVAVVASPQVRLVAAPNPAAVGQRVVHTVDLLGGGPLQVWVSAKGFAQPGLGTLPPGSWNWECCPAEVAGTPAWHYRSAYAGAGSYRFGAVAQVRGTYLSTAGVGASSTGVWVRVI